MNTYLKMIALFCALFLPLSVVATETSVSKLTGDNVLVLYKTGDQLSKKIAEYYVHKRHVPTSQLVAVDIPGNPNTLSQQQFAAIHQHISGYMNQQIKVLLLTWAAPYRVDCMSITSAFTLGYDKKYCSHTAVLSRSCHTTASNPFYNASSTALWQQQDLRLSMMLSGRTFAVAKQLIDRGVAADNSQPTGDGYLVRTQDANRSSRWPTFKRFAELWPQQKGITMHYIDDSHRASGTQVKNKKKVMFYQTGYSQVPDINSNSYLPGAIADHLTSFGGTGIAQHGQMKVYRWLEAGVTGSYGAVIEPCNYPEKFPNAQILIPSYLSGDSLIEAYWKSVQQPGEGIFVGEPLASPWRAE